MLFTEVALLDELLERYASVLGDDLTAYRNHTYRVMNFCSALSANNTPEQLQKMAIAAAFHDMGIWTDRTFDYLEPSEKLAKAYLAQSGNEDLTPEVVAMISAHHKITAYKAAPDSLVESFRKADWIDVSKGLLTFGLPRTLVREVLCAFPNAGFHKRLVQLSFKRLLTHPFSPLPMMRL
ncbi:MAG: HD domain-containing protein [Pseudomonas sp.]|uniref:HD domain-containing protein n=1 Tax=Pseudomonas sp. TaxID=306 RepID=UPI003BB72794